MKIMMILLSIVLVLCSLTDAAVNLTGKETQDPCLNECVEDNEKCTQSCLDDSNVYVCKSRCRTNYNECSAECKAESMSPKDKCSQKCTEDKRQCTQSCEGVSNKYTCLSQCGTRDNACKLACQTPAIRLRQTRAIRLQVPCMTECKQDNRECTRFCQGVNKNICLLDCRVSFVECYAKCKTPSTTWDSD